MPILQGTEPRNHSKYAHVENVLMPLSWEFDKDTKQ